MTEKQKAAIIENAVEHITDNLFHRTQATAVVREELREVLVGLISQLRRA